MEYEHVQPGSGGTTDRAVANTTANTSAGVCLVLRMQATRALLAYHLSRLSPISHLLLSAFSVRASRHPPCLLS